MSKSTSNRGYDGNTYGSVEGKIHGIAEQFTDCDYLFADYSQANVHFDHIEKPTIMYVLPPSGNLTLDGRHSQFLDRPLVQLWFLCPADFDFDGEENECRVEAMKRLGMQFLLAVNKSGLFEQIEGNVPYQVAYDAYDENLTGVCFTPTLKEKEGVTFCDGTLGRKTYDLTK